MISAAPPPTLVYSARFYDPRPKVRSYFHLYEYQAGQKGTRPQQLTYGSRNDYYVRPAPNGRDIFFVREGRKNEASHVCCLNRKNGKIRTVFTGSAKGFLREFSVSPDGRRLLVTQVCRFGLFPNDKTAEAVYLVQMNPNNEKRIWRKNELDGRTENYEWLLNGDLLLTMAPHSQNNGVERYSVLKRSENFQTAHSILSRTTDSPDGLFSPNKKLFLSVKDSSRSLSNTDKPVPAVVLRVPDGQEVARFTENAHEFFDWLDNTRLIGFTQKDLVNGSISRFRIVEVASGKTILDKPLTLGMDVQKALIDDGRDAINLSAVTPLPNRIDAFVLGTSNHRWQTGVQALVSVQTGKATLWNKCGTPYSSSDHGPYFYAFPGPNFAVIGKRRDGTTMTEAVQQLYVGRWDTPKKLVPVVAGAADEGSEAWLPAPLDSRQKVPAKRPRKASR